jgi:hypothetical protein
VIAFFIKSTSGPSFTQLDAVASVSVEAVFSAGVVQAKIVVAKSATRIVFFMIFLCFLRYKYMYLFDTKKYFRAQKDHHFNGALNY